jgi:hypothetical protein
MATQIRITKEAQSGIDAYVEYCQMGGESLYGPFSEQSHQKLKADLAHSKKEVNVCEWRNSQNSLCQAIGPSKKCFCGHPFKEHDHFNTKTDKIKCKYQGCSCPLFSYLPIRGSGDLKCICKHSFSVHNVSSRKCKSCSGCSEFEFKNACACGLSYLEHSTVVRVVQGNPTGNMLTNFSDMLPEDEKYGANIDTFNQRLLGLESQKPKMQILGKQGSKVPSSSIPGALASGIGYELFKTPHKLA